MDINTYYFYYFLYFQNPELKFKKKQKSNFPYVIKLDRVLGLQLPGFLLFSYLIHRPRPVKGKPVQVSPAF